MPAVPAGAESDDEAAAEVPGLADVDLFKPAGVRIIPDDPAVDWQNQKLAASEFAAKLGTRRRSAGAPVRTMFLAGLDPQTPGPVASLLSGSTGNGGGRGGQLRLKLYLSLLWVAARAPYNVVRPARAWAVLLGLPDFETKGVRRIQETLRELEQRGFVKVVDNPGGPLQRFPMPGVRHGLQLHAGTRSPRLPAAQRRPGAAEVPPLLPGAVDVMDRGTYREPKRPLAGDVARHPLRATRCAGGRLVSPARAVERFGFSASTRTKACGTFGTSG
jgi:hypothetical protein